MLETIVQQIATNLIIFALQRRWRNHLQQRKRQQNFYVKETHLFANFSWDFSLGPVLDWWKLLNVGSEAILQLIVFFKQEPAQNCFAQTEIVCFFFNVWSLKSRRSISMQTTLVGRNDLNALIFRGSFSKLRRNARFAYVLNFLHRFYNFDGNFFLKTPKSQLP